MQSGNGLTPGAGAMVRHDGMGSTEMQVSADVGSSALAAQAEAEVKARWAIAQRNPRDWDEVRRKLLRECERPRFAETARYTKPVGSSKVSGPSIRFVEVALRCMGNVYCPVTVVAETQTERRVQVMVTDLEANVSWPKQITINKTVERRGQKGRDGKVAPPTDREVLGERLNKGGEKVFIVAATEDELINKENALVSKAIRQSGLRVIPGDLQDEAMHECIQTQNKADKADPDAARKKLIDAFSAIGITPPMLKDYIGHAVEQLQPAELQDLREIYAAIRDGESKWADVLELKREGGDGAASPAVQNASAPPAPPQAAASTKVPNPANGGSTPPTGGEASSPAQSGKSEAPPVDGRSSEAKKNEAQVTEPQKELALPPAESGPDPVDQLLADIKGCKTIKDIDAVAARAKTVTGPRRGEVGKALNEQRGTVKGG